MPEYFMTENGLIGEQYPEDYEEKVAGKKHLLERLIVGRSRDAEPEPYIILELQDTNKETHAYYVDPASMKDIAVYLIKYIMEGSL